MTKQETKEETKEEMELDRLAVSMAGQEIDV